VFFQAHSLLYGNFLVTTPSVLSLSAMADVKTSPAEKSGLADANDRPPSEVAVATESMSMEHYRATVPLWKRILQHSLTQMMLLSV
jgi:hypothetical protein